MASEFPQLVANALVSGAQYSTVAVGFSVAYAGAKFFDLSFSAALAVAAYATLVSVSTMPPVVAVMVGASCSALLATTTHFLVFRPLALRKPAPETRLLASLGLLLAVVNVLGLEFGDAPIGVLLEAGIGLPIGSARVTVLQIYSIGVAGVVCITAALVRERTSWGLALRGQLEDAELATVKGVPVNRVAVSCIVAGSAVGGIAAGLFALQSPIQPLSGFNLLLPGFIAAVAGGLGRVIRPAVFGLLVALSEHIVAWHLGAAWQDAIVPVLLVVVLAVGFGRRAFRLNAGWGTKR